MTQKKTPLEAATSMAKFMLHRLQLGASMFAFSKQQIAGLVAEAKEYTKAIEGEEILQKDNALYSVFFAMQLFDVETTPYYDMRKHFGYTQVLGFFETTKINWVTAIREFASFYPKEMDLPEGYTYRIEDTDANVDDWIAKLPGHLTGASGVITDVQTEFHGERIDIPHVLNGVPIPPQFNWGDPRYRPELSLVPPVTKDGKPWSGEIRPQQDTGYIRLLSPNEAQIDEAIRDMMSQVLNPETRSPSQMVQSMRLTDVTLFEPGFDFRRQLICMAAWVQNVAVMRGGHLVLENFLHGDKAIVSFPFPRIMNAELVIREAAPHGFVHVAITRNPHPNTTKFQDQWHYHINGKFAQLSEDVTANVAASAITSHAIFAV